MSLTPDQQSLVQLLNSSFDVLVEHLKYVNIAVQKEFPSYMEQPLVQTYWESILLNLAKDANN
jgi:hypothetical protein